MRMRRLITALIGAICILATVFAVGALAADGGCVVSLSTENKLEQGSGGYASVSIAPSAPLATITVSVHYDESLLTVYDHYNAIGAKLYDASVTDGCIQYTYIFASDSEEISGELFYFYYQINEDARVGEYTLDVTVSEAYSPSLELLDVRGSRSSITVTERKAELYNYIYSDSGIELSVGEETTLSYYVANTEVVGGALDFVYDPELFELVSVEYGGLLDGKVVDCNSSQSGAVYLSFVGTDYSYDNRIASLTLRAIKNLDTETEISLSVSELYDKELRSYKCDGAASAVSINYDPSYVEDAPRMSIGISYDESTGRVIATLKLDRDSHLGAGDFTLSFNPELLSFISAEKGFSPSFFNVNDKKISDGILKLSIISLTDITDETTVLTVSFEAKSFCEARLAELGLTGSSLTDSMTVPILLNLTGASLSLPEKHTPAEAVTENRTEPNCTTDGKYDSVVYCSVCKEELTRETVTIGALGHTPSAAVIENRTEPNCTTDGKYDSVIYCSVCKEELTRVTEIIPKLGHDYSAEWTVDLEPTCTEKGSKSHHCTRCGDKAKITEIAANGHTFGEYTSNGDATYDADGTKSAVCSNCGATDTQPDEGTALGETARFEDTVNALLPIDRAPSYSELREAIVIYQRLDGGERESVAETYAKLVKMVEDYNNRVGEINTATDEATEAAFAPLALMGYAFLAALLAILKKLLSR